MWEPAFVCVCICGSVLVCKCASVNVWECMRGVHECVGILEIDII